MRRIRIDAEKSCCGYDLIIKNGLISSSGDMIAGMEPSSLAIISNDVVLGFYEELIKTRLKSLKIPISIISIPDGERYKNLETLKLVIKKMLLAGCDRESLLMTFGGGVTGDLGGFAAATFMRGINYIHIPTSLLSQVDSSIGGKVGIDLPWGKNLMGAFYQPRMVIIDPLLLRTLPDREFSNGMAEIIKSSMISSPHLLKILENSPGSLKEYSDLLLEEIVFLTAKIKSGIIGRDLYEAGERMKLNFGHTIGHGLEVSTNYTGLSHGQAISLGMIAACNISKKLGILEDNALLLRLKKLLAKFNLPIKYPKISTEKVAKAIFMDKKKYRGKLRFILPIRTGNVKIFHDIDFAIIKESIGLLADDG